MRTKWENPCVIGRIIVPQNVHVLEILLSRPHPSHIKSMWVREVCSEPQEHRNHHSCWLPWNHPGSQGGRSRICFVPARILGSELLYLNSLNLTIICNFDSFT